MGAVRLAMRPTPADEPPLVAEVNTETTSDTVAPVIDDMKFAEIRQEPSRKKAMRKSKKVARKRSSYTTLSPQDSVEVTRTEADLELAESEYLAEQMALEQELQELRRFRAARQNGWHYTLLPCE